MVFAKVKITNFAFLKIRKNNWFKNNKNNKNNLKKKSFILLVFKNFFY